VARGTHNIRPQSAGPGQPINYSAAMALCATVPRRHSATPSAARLFAFAFTVNVTVVPVDAVPEVEEAVSQFGAPEIE
jgi:hypothetical protein